MDIKIRRIYRLIDLAEYFEVEDEEDNQRFEVWVNPPSEVLTRWSDIRKENERINEWLVELSDNIDTMSEEVKSEVAQAYPKMNKDIFAFYAELWRVDGKHESAEDIGEFAERCWLDDPTLWVWLIGRTWDRINEHRDIARKK